jgi:aminoglycoside phosphotransferase family enzyme
MENSVEEIRINRQLAKDIYIGVVPLVTNETGKLELEGKGEIIDWLVKMKRIPEKNMLDYAIEYDCIDEIQLQNTAALLAEFYKRSLPVDMSATQYIKKLESEIFFNYNELTNPIYELPLTLLRELTAGQMAFLSANHSMIEKRTGEKRIIDAHGDLRPEHICLAPYSAIIDRLEFCKDLRTLDIVEELSFLSVECEIMRNTHVGHVFFDRYKAINNDNIPHRLINFYKIKRACLRAYLVARHIEEQQYKEDPKWLLKANAYVRLAERIHQQYAM